MSEGFVVKVLLGIVDPYMQVVWMLPTVGAWPRTFSRFDVYTETGPKRLVMIAGDIVVS